MDKVELSAVAEVMRYGSSYLLAPVTPSRVASKQLAPQLRAAKLLPRRLLKQRTIEEANY